MSHVATTFSADRLATSPELKADLDTIMDCMGGADGGVGFVKLKLLLAGCERVTDPAQVAAAQEIIETARRFARLIRTAEKQR